MTITKDFILRNLFILRDKHGETNEDALDNLVDYFRDELWLKFDQEEAFASYEWVRREMKFEERAREMILSINQ